MVAGPRLLDCRLGPLHDRNRPDSKIALGLMHAESVMRHVIQALNVELGEREP